MHDVAILRRRAADFRQHPAMEFGEPHWLVNAIYGRQLLKTKLRQTRPDLKVSRVRHQPEYDPLLEAMVDVLDLREWPEPNTVLERLKALREILRRTWDLDKSIEPLAKPPAQTELGV